MSTRTSTLQASSSVMTLQSHSSFHYETLSSVMRSSAQADYGQLKLVFEALHERKTMIENARHLSGLLPTLTPCYKFYEVTWWRVGARVHERLIV